MTDRRDGWCLFEYAHFQQAAVFLSSEFHGPVTLAGSVFDKSVDLRHTVFAATSTFDAPLSWHRRDNGGPAGVETGLACLSRRGSNEFGIAPRKCTASK
jgi:hypothetical protein